MPHLTFFLACSKVITSVEDNSLSLIAIMEGLQATIPPGITPQGVESIPMPWVAIAEWEQEPGDSNKPFELRIQILRPDREVALEGLNSFTFATRRHRTPFNINGFPIGQAGKYSIQISIREQDSDSDWHFAGEYSVYVEHNHPPPAEESGAEPINENQQDKAQ